MNSMFKRTTHPIGQTLCLLVVTTLSLTSFSQETESISVPEGYDIFQLTIESCSEAAVQNDVSYLDDSVSMSIASEVTETDENATCAIKDKIIKTKNYFLDRMPADIEIMVQGSQQIEYRVFSDLNAGGFASLQTASNRNSRSEFADDRPSVSRDRSPSSGSSGRDNSSDRGGSFAPTRSQRPKARPKTRNGGSDKSLLRSGTNNRTQPELPTELMRSPSASPSIKQRPGIDKGKTRNVSKKTKEQKRREAWRDRMSRDNTGGGER